MNESAAGRIGFWAAAATALFSIAYSVGQIFEWLGLLGSQGGPNASSTPLGIVVLLIPSLLLGPAYVVMLAALHEVAPARAKTASRAALALGIIYAALTGLVYFVQLTFVGPRLASGNVQGIELLLFVPYKSFLFAIDLYGYALMCLSALFAAWAVPPEPVFGRAALWLKITGLLTPALALQMYVPELIWAGSIWGISFPVAAVLLCRGFAGLSRS